ncbi:GDP/GTP exchange factor [Schizosaccharomyces japonicus yFS275]|uniref:Guanine nucleotide-exchange factor SEC12 n=1 Tax=Schizosaccharomyces japonicus (strain yFS275 / FY16936) TaxID=402676 RepID=B6K7A7_SCHJY|nr:GDP/GTP exchange factor [Schizosaccharomyces japonicus yFS275]EEB09411.1 GDP/GTP exchange factor [Schizosaccharomyces japonicus yFS275]
MAMQDLGFPAYAVTWITNSVIAVGGGGGASNTGVKNQLKVFGYNEDEGNSFFVPMQDIELKDTDDAVMSLDSDGQILIAGINDLSDESSNKHLRIYKKNAKNLFEFEASYQLANFTNSEEYQRLCRYNTQRKLIFIACTNKTFSVIHKYDSGLRFELKDLDVFDISFSPEYCAFASTNAIHIYNWEYKLVQRLELPFEKVSIRGVALMKKNAVLCAFNRVENGTRLGYLARFEMDPKAKVWAFKKSLLLKNSRGITAFCAENVSGMLVIATADCTLRIMTNRLQPISKIPLHKLPITCVSLSPDAENVATVSADGTLAVTYVGKYKVLSSVKITDVGIAPRLLIFAVFVALIAVLYMNILFPGRVLEEFHNFTNMMTHRTVLLLTSWKRLL